MKGLLIKDFKLLKTQKLFLIVITAFCGYLLVIGKVQFGMLYAAMMFSMLVVSTANYDDNDNGMSYLFTLPITRRGYVLEKYLFGCILMGLAFAAASMIIAATSIATSASYLSEDLFGAGFGFWLTGSIILCATLPLQIKYGAEKGRIALGAVFICLAVAGYVFREAATAFEIDISALTKPFLHAGMIQIAIMLTVLIVAMFGISYLISVSFMKKRQF